MVGIRGGALEYVGVANGLLVEVDECLEIIGVPLGVLAGDGPAEVGDEPVGAVPEQLGGHLAANEGGDDALVHAENADDLPLLGVALEANVAYPVANVPPEVEEEAVVLEAVGVELGVDSVGAGVGLCDGDVLGVVAREGNGAEAAGEVVVEAALVGMLEGELGVGVVGENGGSRAGKARVADVVDHAAHLLVGHGDAGLRAGLRAGFCAGFGVGLCRRCPGVTRTHLERLVEGILRAAPVAGETDLPGWVALGAVFGAALAVLGAKGGTERGAEPSARVARASFVILTGAGGLMLIGSVGEGHCARLVVRKGLRLVANWTCDRCGLW